ncbi:hypothetical protein BT69DRAFT_1079219 [Atractiella rhizophila]|nr:hypothetical protein BT69DRAFT_1079219 [Atractiella rhizophila]
MSRRENKSKYGRMFSRLKSARSSHPCFSNGRPCSIIPIFDFFESLPRKARQTTLLLPRRHSLTRGRSTRPLRQKRSKGRKTAPCSSKAHNIPPWTRYRTRIAPSPGRFFSVKRPGILNFKRAITLSPELERRKEEVTDLDTPSSLRRRQEAGSSRRAREREHTPESSTKLDVRILVYELQQLCECQEPRRGEGKEFLWYWEPERR